VESAELIAILREVRERVRARNPQTAPGASAIPLPDLMSLVHARDSAMGKVAAIGTVNPRPGGLVNSLVQGWKRFVARVLDWHVREQVEFNRKLIDCMDAVVEAFTENNRLLSEFGTAAEECRDVRSHWDQWRVEWERKLERNEIQFLRSVADLQGAFQHRSNLMDASYRDAVRGQHLEFTAALERSGQEIQKRLWADLERMRADYERLIYAELKIIRQRAEVSRVELPACPTSLNAGQAGKPTPPAFDYGRFAERFRGSEEYVKAGQQFYLPYFQHCRQVLDIGCGRGEFLEMMRQSGVPARGIDLSEESVAWCRRKGLDAELADLFAYLEALPEAALDGVFCSQVVEHLPPERLAEVVKLAASRLQRNGVVAIETPNPECLAIFASHFYLDPTHTRPVPSALLVFYLEEFGMGNIEVRRLSPALESMPSLGSLPEDLREAFFGGLDYAVIARKL
jgi:2-polyprenyl-3-methyl-5-hydroxy-6-metoxy-1,4-benzoquinol methylase